MQILSTKTYNHSIGLSACFRQWRAHSHCRFLHGYALKVKFTFAADALDERNWVVDFGGLKNLKGWLEDTFDHKTLIAEDDPMLGTFKQLDDQGLIQLRIVPACGCEKFAEMIYEYTEQWLKDAGFGPRCQLVEVEVSEHEGNSAICRA
jgi:6-pyruvoyltetrahydropterin/6-carboxytetrahydropterin synthase